MLGVRLFEVGEEQGDFDEAAELGRMCRVSRATVRWIEVYSLVFDHGSLPGRKLLQDYRGRKIAIYGKVGLSQGW